MCCPGRHDLHKRRTRQEDRTERRANIFCHYHKFMLDCHSLVISRSLLSRHGCSLYPPSLVSLSVSCLHNIISFDHSSEERKKGTCVRVHFTAEEPTWEWVGVCNEILNRHFVLFSRLSLARLLAYPRTVKQQLAIVINIHSHLFNNSAYPRISFVKRHSHKNYNVCFYAAAAVARHHWTRRRNETFPWH